MHGGLTQGAGQVLGEQSVYDPESGQLLTGSFMDYFMPRAGVIGEITLLDHPVPTQTNPLGAKGCGEAGCAGSMTAGTSAILDALAGAGVRRFDMPATPVRIWQAIRTAQLQP